MDHLSSKTNTNCKSFMDIVILTWVSGFKKDSKSCIISVKENTLK
jgi:hypothetical protein